MLVGIKFIWSGNRHCQYCGEPCNVKYIQKFSDDILSNAILKSNMILQQIKVGKSVRPLFHVILTGQFFSAIIVMIQGQKVNFKLK